MYSGFSLVKGYLNSIFSVVTSNNGVSNNPATTLKKDQSFIDLFQSQVDSQFENKTLHLNFHTNITQDQLIQTLQQNPQVTAINIACLPINDKVLFFIAENFPNLEELNVMRCTRLTKEGFDALGQKCHQLKRLTTSYLNLADGEYGGLLAGIPNLEYWKINHTASMGPNTFQQLSEYNPNLKTLIVKFPTFRFDPEGLDPFLSKASSLQKLDFSYFTSFNDENLSTLFQNAKNLEYFKISAGGNGVKLSAKVIAECLANAPESLTHFETFDLTSSRFAQIEFDDLFSKQNLQLKALSLCGLSEISSDSFSMISQSCPNLATLSLQRCKENLVSDILAGVVNGLPKLQELTISQSSFPADCLNKIDNPSLTSIKFENCQWRSVDSLKYFDNPSFNLKKFHATLMEFDNNEGLYDFLGKQPNLTEWTLTMDDGVFPMDSTQLGQVAFEDLTYLEISAYPPQITDEAMATVVSQNPRLAVANITVGSTGNLLAAALTQLKALQDVYLVCDNSLSNDAFKSLTNSKLKNAYLSNIPENGGEILKDFVTKNHFIRLDIYKTSMSSADLVESVCANPCSSYLNFTYTNLDDEGLNEILTKFTALAGLKIAFCNVSSEAIKAAQDNFSYVNIQYSK
jgi:hypothetical protein